MDKIVYTAEFGGYDVVWPVDPNWGCTFVCFTDDKDLVVEGWKMVYCDLDGESPAQANRRYKMLPHLIFPDNELSLYVDANIKLLSDPSPLFDMYLSNSDIAMPLHFDRQCIYDEAKKCVALGIVDKVATEKQMARYASDGLPKDQGLTENGIIFRRHNKLTIVRLMNDWWNEYLLGVKRDQLSLPYLLWKHSIRVEPVLLGPRKSSKYFAINLHKKAKSNSLIIQMIRIIEIRKNLNIFYSFLYQIILLMRFCYGKLEK